MKRLGQSEPSLLYSRLTPYLADLILNQMVHNKLATLASLADPVRMGIVTQLAKGDASVSALAAPFDMSLQAVRKHLGVLESAGVVQSRKNGRVRLCTLRKDPIEDAVSWLGTRAKLWDTRLDALATIVENRRLK